MKKYIVLSVNENPQYLYYLPLTVWCWRKFGWEPIVFYNGPITNCSDLCERTFDNIHEEMTAEMKGYYRLKSFILNGIPAYRSDTITQVSRLYAACILEPESLIMTGDIDMLPLSDYWHPDPSVINAYGHDLTGYQHIPICYVAMTGYRWREVMGLSTCDYNALIKRDLDSMPNAKSTEFEKWWSVDQQLITERINATSFQKNFVHRGTYSNGYPIGRVDRSAWTLQHDVFVDAHLPRDMYKTDDTGVANFAKVMRLLYRAFPEDSFDWFASYTEEFRRLVS